MIVVLSHQICENLLYQLQEDNTHPLRQQSPTILAPGTGFVEDNFSMDRGSGAGDGIRRFKRITFIVHFISIIITW